MSEVRGKSIGEAYLNALKSSQNEELPFIVIHISHPVTSLANLPEESFTHNHCEIDNWTDNLNLGEIYKPFTKFNFEKECGSGGSSGKDWINDRIKVLFKEGEIYHDRLHEWNQLCRIKKRLQKGNHGGCTNALVAQVFRINEEGEKTSDFDRAVSGAVRASMACLTQLQFKPLISGDQKTLNLYSTFRSLA